MQVCTYCYYFAFTRSDLVDYRPNEVSNPSLSVLNDSLCDGFEDDSLEGAQWADQSL